MEILTPWTGEILALCMLLILNGRIFWTRRTRLDALSLLAPFSLATITLVATAWGIRLSTTAIFVLSLVCLIINYRSMVRFSQRLFVDAYSIKFFVTSLILLIITIFFLAVEITGRPIRLQTRRYNVEVQREFFSCPLLWENFPLKKAEEVGDRRNMTLYTFTNKNKLSQKDTVIVFVPDVLAESLAYEPYFILLARKGWTVLTADVYDLNFHRIQETKFLRRASTIWGAYSAGGMEAIKKQKFPEPREKRFYGIYESSYRALKQIASERYPGKKIFVVGDSSSFLPPSKLTSIFPDSRFMNLKSESGYTTPGYGFVAQTNPVFSKFFLGKKRDKTSFEPSWCATQTIKEINK